MSPEPVKRYVPRSIGPANTSISSPRLRVGRHVIEAVLVRGELPPMPAGVPEPMGYPMGTNSAIALPQSAVGELEAALDDAFQNYLSVIHAAGGTYISGNGQGLSPTSRELVVHAYEVPDEIWQTRRALDRYVHLSGSGALFVNGVDVQLLTRDDSRTTVSPVPPQPRSRAEAAARLVGGIRIRIGNGGRFARRAIDRRVRVVELDEDDFVGIARIRLEQATEPGLGADERERLLNVAHDACVEAAEFEPTFGLQAAAISFTFGEIEGARREMIHALREIEADARHRNGAAIEEALPYAIPGDAGFEELLERVIEDSDEEVMRCLRNLAQTLVDTAVQRSHLIEDEQRDFVVSVVTLIAGDAMSEQLGLLALQFAIGNHRSATELLTAAINEAAEWGALRADTEGPSEYGTLSAGDIIHSRVIHVLANIGSDEGVASLLARAVSEGTAHVSDERYDRSVDERHAITRSEIDAILAARVPVSQWRYGSAFVALSTGHQLQEELCAVMTPQQAHAVAMYLTLLTEFHPEMRGVFDEHNQDVQTDAMAAERMLRHQAVHERAGDIDDSLRALKALRNAPRIGPPDLIRAIRDATMFAANGDAGEAHRLFNDTVHHIADIWIEDRNAASETLMMIFAKEGRNSDALDLAARANEQEAVAVYDEVVGFPRADMGSENALIHADQRRFVRSKYGHGASDATRTASLERCFFRRLNLWQLGAPPWPPESQQGPGAARDKFPDPRFLPEWSRVVAEQQIPRRPAETRTSEATPVADENSGAPDALRRYGGTVVALRTGSDLQAELSEVMPAAQANAVATYLTLRIESDETRQRQEAEADDSVRTVNPSTHGHVIGPGDFISAIRDATLVAADGRTEEATRLFDETAHHVADIWIQDRNAACDTLMAIFRAGGADDTLNLAARANEQEAVAAHDQLRSLRGSHLSGRQDVQIQRRHQVARIEHCYHRREELRQLGGRPWPAGAEPRDGRDPLLPSPRSLPEYSRVAANKDIPRRPATGHVAANREPKVAAAPEPVTSPRDAGDREAQLPAGGGRASPPPAPGQPTTPAQPDVQAAPPGQARARPARLPRGPSARRNRATTADQVHGVTHDGDVRPGRSTASTPPQDPAPTAAGQTQSASPSADQPPTAFAPGHSLPAHGLHPVRAPREM